MLLSEMNPMAPFVHRRRIRFGETDAAKIVYTVRFFDYAIDSIDAWYEEIVGVSLYALNMHHGVSCPFVHAELDFVRALRPGDDVLTTVLVERMGRSSLSFGIHGALADGQPTCSGCFTVSFITPSTMKSIPIPIPIAERVRLYQARCAEFSAAAPSGDGAAVDHLVPAVDTHRSSAEGNQ